MESKISQLKISDDVMSGRVDTSDSLHAAEPQSLTAISKNASLDRLPAELKLSILQSAPNISTLQTLVRSSPLYHRAYLSEQKSILSAVLLRDIGLDVLPDALAVHRASQIPFDGSGRRYDNVKSFISQYKTERDSSLTTPYDSLDFQTLETLSRVHAVIAGVTFDFCNTALSIHPVTGDKVQNHGELSSIEKGRIYRALYRFELFRVLFTKPRGISVPWESEQSLDCMDKSFLFLTLFKVWEVEELACVRDYITRRHTEIIAESASELVKLRPKKDLIDEYWQKENAGYLMSLGLSFLHKLLNTPFAAGKASILQDKLSYYGEFLTEVLEETPYDSVYATSMYDAAEEGHELLFERDSLVDSPNAAWPWSTGNKVAIYYYEAHKALLRKWAYVMWDIGRLDEWKILEVDPETIYRTTYNLG